MAFAATTPRSPFKCYLVSALYSENMTPFRPTKNQNFTLSISFFGHSRETSTTRRYFCGHFTQLHLTCVEDRAICSHLQGRWRWGDWQGCLH